MNWQWSPVLPWLVGGSLLAIAAAIYVLWHRRDRASSRVAVLLLLAGALWMGGSALELASMDLAAKILWDKVQFVGICIIPSAWLAYALRYTGYERWLTPLTRTLLSAVPLTTFVLAITNESHGLIWRDSWLDTSGSIVVKQATFGVALSAYLAYAYILLFLGTLLLIQALARSGHLHRWQAGAVLLAVLIPWLLNAVENILGWTLLGDVELTPIALCITVPIVAWTFYRLQRRDIITIARDIVVEAIGDALLVLDTDNYIVDLNQVAQRLLGQAARSEVLGQSIEQVWPQGAAQLAGLDGKVAAVLEVILGQGHEKRIYDARISPLTDWRGRRVSQVVVLRDVTELKRRTAELSTLLETTQAASSTLDLEEVLQRIAQQMVRAMGVDGCTLSRWDREKGAVITWIEWRPQWPEWAERAGTVYPLDDYPLTRAVLETGQPHVVRLSDPGADPAEVALMRQMESTSMLLLPLQVRGQVIGLVELDTDEREADYTPAEMRLCQAMADQAAIAIDNARLYQESQRRAEELAALFRVGLTISSSLDIQEVLARVAEQIGQVLNATSAYICSADPTRGSATVLAEYISPEACEEEKVSDLGATYMEPDTAFLRVLREGQPHMDHVDDPALPQYDRSHMTEYGARSILYIPLFTRGTAIGYAEVWESRQRREFTEEEIALGQALAKQVAVALDNARLYEQAQQEIAERRRTEEILRVSEERYRAVVEQTSEGIVLYDVESKRVLESNDAYCKMLDYTPEEMLGLTLYDIVAHDRASIDAYVERIMRDGHCLIGERQHRRKDGSLLDVEVSVTLITYSGREAMSLLVRDTTARREAEEALRRYSERLRILRQIDRGILGAESPATIAQTVLSHIRGLVPYRGGTVVINHDSTTHEAMVLAADTIRGRSLLEPGQPLSPSLLDGLEQALPTAMQSDTLSLDNLMSQAPVTPLGQYLTAEGYRSLLVVPLISQSERIGILALGADSPNAFSQEHKEIAREVANELAVALQQVRLNEQLQRYTTELEEQAEELRRSNAELQQFAYVASHDLQEPLRMVTSYLQLLERRYGARLDADADEFIHFAVDGATRMNQLIKDLLAYSRVSTHGQPFGFTDCEAVLDQAVRNLQLAVEESNASVTHGPLPTVLADASQLTQLFQNLVGNAIKFRSEHPPEVHVQAEQREGEWLFSVRDNGIGIEQQYAERIFLIFQRLHTRDEYPGTGIGLAICQRIVERHGGRIWVESQLGSGATFHFTIPDGGRT
jgi:PAS domain S-box-containing protein